MHFRASKIAFLTLPFSTLILVALNPTVVVSQGQNPPPPDSYYLHRCEAELKEPSPLRPPNPPMLPPSNIVKNLTELVNYDIRITKANFYDPCYREGYCWFITSYKYAGGLSREKSIMPCAKGSFCFRINVKPETTNCDQWIFDMAVIDLPTEYRLPQFEIEMFYVGVGFKQTDNKMTNAYAAYCIFNNRTDRNNVVPGAKFYHGEIVDTKFQPTCVDTVKCRKSCNAVPDATRINKDNDGVFHCGFRAHNLLELISHADEVVNFGSGDFFMLMAFGPKFYANGTSEYQHYPNLMDSYIDPTFGVDVLLKVEKHCPGHSAAISLPLSRNPSWIKCEGSKPSAPPDGTGVIWILLLLSEWFNIM